MSLLRAELRGNGNIVKCSSDNSSFGVRFSGIYEGIIEHANDLSLPRLSGFSPGSLMICLDDGKLYCKVASGEWKEITSQKEAQYESV